MATSSPTPAMSSRPAGWSEGPLSVPLRPAGDSVRVCSYSLWPGQPVWTHESNNRARRACHWAHGQATDSPQRAAQTPDRIHLATGALFAPSQIASSFLARGDLRVVHGHPIAPAAVGGDLAIAEVSPY